MEKEIDKTKILDALIKYYKFKSKYKFAAFIGIKQSTLSSWYSRNTVDWELIFTKCNDIDFETLIKTYKAVPSAHSLEKKGEEAAPVNMKNKQNDYPPNALQMIKELAAENALLKKEIDELKKT